MDEDVQKGFTKQRATRLGSEILKNPEDPVYPLVKEYSDVVSKHPPSQLPPDRGVRHEIDLVPGTKYCVTRQWPLPREQCEVIDAFFAEKAKSGMVRESKSLHSTPTFCVRKPNGKWRLVHAYNKLNNATVPAQTPIPRKDVLLNNMSDCTLYSTLYLVDGYYQILMRESDIPLTAVSTPSGMLWEWLVMPQGLSNAPATFNRLVTQLFRPLRTFAQTYFDDIFVHSRVEGGQTAVEVHLKHLRRVFEVMRANKLYSNIDKCVFAAEVIKVLGCFVSRVGVRANPGKVKAIAAWPTPWSQKDLRKWLGLANYLVPNDENLKYDVLLEAHDASMSGRLGREKTYQARVKRSGHASSLLHSLPVPADCWKSMSLDFVFGLPADDKGNTGLLVFVCRLSKMVHLASVRDKVTEKQTTQLVLDSVFRYHGLPETVVSDRDPSFTGAFWDTLFHSLGTKLTMSTAHHPQMERVNSVLEDTLRNICADTHRARSDQLPIVEFALNNAVHTSTGFTPFYLNGLRHPQVPLTLRGGNDASIVVSSVESNKLKHRFIGPFAVLAKHGAAYIIDLPKSMATHPTFYVGHLMRYHDPLGPPSQTEKDQGENSPPRNEAESSGQPELPVSEPVTDTQAGTHESHTKGMTGESRNSAVNTPVELPSLMTKSVQILTKDL
ncbi:Pol protein [Phytophthora palmivora]|uniref:Pol protein n=1 Tax=Phytophthora palmivora TaxID=4796 RepID=A0A2P4XEB2_9STRA|nr:Pol protein [Phytophthora palmivora]